MVGNLIFIPSLRFLPSTSPGLFFSTRRLVFSTRRLVKPTRRVVYPGCRVVKAWTVKHSRGWQMGDSFHSARARIYYIYPPKKRSPVHRPYVSGWFPYVPGVKAWGDEAFTRCHTVHSREGSGRGGLWTLENPNLHTRSSWKSGENDLHVKGWIHFLRIKKRKEYRLLVY